MQTKTLALLMFAYTFGLMSASENVIAAEGPPVHPSPAAPSSSLSNSGLPVGMALDLSSSTQSVAATNSSPTTITVGGDLTRSGLVEGGNSMVVQPGAMITPAQFLALSQVMSGQPQALLVSEAGVAQAGNVTIAATGSTMLAGLNVPSGVIVNALNFSPNAPLIVGGSAVVEGSMYAFHSAPQGISTLNFGSLTVGVNGLLAGAVPSGLGGFAPATMNINIVENLHNFGTISTPAGVLNVTTGGAIFNQSVGVAQAQITAQALNLTSQIGNIVNSGIIAASNISLASLAGHNLLLNNEGGLLSATYDISVRDTLNFVLQGGAIASQAFKIDSIGCDLDIQSNLFTPILSIDAGGRAQVMVVTPQLNIGRVVLEGSGHFYNSGGAISLQDNVSTTGGNLVFVSTGDISSAEQASTISTNSNYVAGDILVAAGADFSHLDASNILLSGASLSGGSIDFTNGSGVRSLETRGLGNDVDGEKIVLLAFDGSGANSGRILLPPALRLETTGTGTSADGSSLVVEHATLNSQLTPEGGKLTEGVMGDRASTTVQFETLIVPGATLWTIEEPGGPGIPMLNIDTNPAEAEFALLPSSYQMPESELGPLTLSTFVATAPLPPRELAPLSSASPSMGANPSAVSNNSTIAVASLPLWLAVEPSIIYRLTDGVFTTGIPSTLLRVSPAVNWSNHRLIADLPGDSVTMYPAEISHHSLLSAISEASTPRTILDGTVSIVDNTSSPVTPTMSNTGVGAEEANFGISFSAVQYAELIKENSNSIAEASLKVFDWVVGDNDMQLTQICRLPDSNAKQLPNGVVVTTLANGTTVCQFPNKTTVITLRGNIKVTLLANGTRITELPGDLIFHQPRTGKQLPGKIVITERPDQYVAVNLPDGTRMVSKAENGRVSLPADFTATEGHLEFSLPAGDCLIHAESVVRIKIGAGRLKVHRNSVVASRRSGSHAILCNLHDDRVGGVQYCTLKSIVDLNPGQAIVVSQHQEAAPNLPFPSIGIRDFHHVAIPGVDNVFVCDISIPSTFPAMGVVRQTLSSTDFRDRMLAKKLMKMSVILSHTTKAGKPYSNKRGGRWPSRFPWMA